MVDRLRDTGNPPVTELGQGSTYGGWVVPRPDLTGLCRRCRVTEQDVKAREIIVSPGGMAHIGDTYGDTACGIAATGDNWWWPL